MKLLRGLFFAVSMAAAGEAFAGGTFYGSGTNGELFTINIATGAGTLVGTLPALCFGGTAAGVTEIEFDNASGRAFAACFGDSFSGFQFNITTAAAIGGEIQNGGDGLDGTFNGLEAVGGLWYGTVTFAAQGPSELQTFNPVTGVSTLIGATGVGPVAGLAYDKGTGTMYGIAGGPGPANFYTINLATGAATVVGSTGIQAGSLEFGPDGRLYAGGTGTGVYGGKLYVINPATGAATLVGPTGLPPVPPSVTPPGVTGLTLVEEGYFTVAPCRVIDTRNPAGPLGAPALVAQADRTFTIAGACGIPPTAFAVSVNMAVIGSTAAGNLRLHPGGTAVPLISSINYSAGQTRANNAISPLNALGQLAVFNAQASGTVEFILDVNGYFQ